ncbi:MAG: porin [Opitutae bacterium]|nr:porin [Opitutae bacterium]
MMLKSLLFASAFALTLAPRSLAQSGASTPPAETARTKISGWIEAGVTLNPASPADRQNFGRLFDDRANEPLLNQAVITVERTLAPQPGEFDWGFKLQGMLGSDARFIHSLGLLDNTGRRLLQPDIPEAYLNLHFAAFTAGGLDVKIGKFVTLEGAETIDPRTTVFYSHSYLFNFGIPFNHSGVLATLHASKQFDLMAGLTRGVNTTLDDNNSVAAFHGGLGFTGLLDGKLSGVLSTHFGPETPNNNRDYRYLNDLTFTYALSDRESLVVDLNRIQDDASNTKGTGGVVYYTRKLSGTVTLGVRGEIWSDRDAFYVAQFGNNDDVLNGLRGVPLTDPRTVGGGSTTYRALTLGVQVQVPVAKPFAGLVIRPELRFDSSSRTAPFDDSTRKSQVTFGVDAVLTF